MQTIFRHSTTNTVFQGYLTWFYTLFHIVNQTLLKQGQNSTCSYIPHAMRIYYGTYSALLVL